MKIARFSSIFFINLAVKEAIDVILNPILMAEFGYFISFLITTVIYILIGILSVNIYDSSQSDCLWVEEYKHSKDSGKSIIVQNRIIRFVEKWANKNKYILGLLLSFKNPGLYVIFFRKGSYLFNGFSERKIKILFLVNIIIINVYWNTIVYSGMPFFILIWHLIKKLYNFI